MERLTYEGNFCDISQCRELPCKHDGDCSQKQVWERLKQFEDAVQTPENFYKMYGEFCLLESALKNYGGPERVKELVKADKDGRVVVLPCKVGDMAYWVHNGVITGCHVQRIQVNRKGTFICLKSTVSHGGFRTDACLGKTVFHTREEAEKALQEMGGKA